MLRYCLPQLLLINYIINEISISACVISMKSLDYRVIRLFNFV